MRASRFGGAGALGWGVPERRRRDRPREPGPDRARRDGEGADRRRGEDAPLPAAPAREAAELARCFLEDRVEQLRRACRRATGWWPSRRRRREAELRALVPPATCGSCPSAGADLGARMSGLLADLLAEGYAGAIVVGTDTPTLPTAYLVEAAAALRRRRGRRGAGAERGRRLLPDRAHGARAGPLRRHGVEHGDGLRGDAPRARAAGRRISVLPTWFDIDRIADLARLRDDPGRDAYRPRRTLACLARLAF